MTESMICGYCGKETLCTGYCDCEGSRKFWGVLHPLHNQQPSIAPEQALKPEIVKAKRPRKKDPLKGLPEFGYWRERNAEQFPLFMEWVKKEKGFLSVDIKLNGLDLWCEYVYLYNRELILQNAGVENESNRLSYNTQSNI
jgi:hypothetical protein